MSETSITSIRMNPTLKKQFETTCKKMGITFSTAINIFARKVVRDQKIPFELEADTPNSKTRQILDNVEKGKNLSKTFNSVEELLEDLYAEN